jgi:hypothetical protein
MDKRNGKGNVSRFCAACEGQGDFHTCRGSSDGAPVSDLSGGKVHDLPGNTPRITGARWCSVVVRIYDKDGNSQELHTRSTGTANETT